MASFYDLFYGGLNLLSLLAAGGAAVVALVMRGKYPKRATYATIGFGMLVLTALIYLVSPFLADLAGSDAFRVFYPVINAFAGLLHIGAIAVLVLALFRSEETPRQPGQPPYGQQPYQGQPPAPYGQPQYQQQPPQGQPYQGQPHPGQQPHPYQQQQPPPPPQQYPGSGY